MQKTFSGHRHYVQGVAWDPLGECILTLSTDRTMRVVRGNAAKQHSRPLQSDVAAAANFTQANVVFKHVIAGGASAFNDTEVDQGQQASENVMARSQRGAEPRQAATHCRSSTGTAGAERLWQGQAVVSGSVGTVGPKQKAHAVGCTAGVASKGAAKAGTEKAGYIFQDESINTFFRRLAFSPEGSFVVAPAASLGPLTVSRRCATLLSQCRSLVGSRPSMARLLGLFARCGTQRIEASMNLLPTTGVGAFWLADAMLDGHCCAPGSSSDAPSSPQTFIRSCHGALVGVKLRVDT
jgi:hypothetical protein